jgi:ABC-2 type transporter
LRHERCRAKHAGAVWRFWHERHARPWKALAPGSPASARRAVHDDVHPDLFLVVNTGQAAEIFPSDTTGFLEGQGYGAFQLPITLLLAASFGMAALFLVEEIEGGYFDKLRAIPVPRYSIVLGRLVAEAAKGVVISSVIVLIALPFGIEIASGPLGFLLLVALVAGESELEALAGAHPDQRLGLDLGLERRADAARPGDRGLRVGKRGRAADVELHRLAIGNESHQPGSTEVDVEQAAGEDASGSALHARHVPLDAGLEGQGCSRR